MDGAPTGSVAVSISKARSAALFKRATKVFQDQLAAGGDGLRVLKLEQAIPVEGGLPLVMDGKVVGAIGSVGRHQRAGRAVRAGRREVRSAESRGIRDFGIWDSGFDCDRIPQRPHRSPITRSSDRIPNPEPRTPNPEPESRIPESRPNPRIPNPESLFFDLPVADPPDRVRRIVGDEQRAVGGDGDGDRPSPHVAAFVGDEAGQEVLCISPVGTPFLSGTRITL